MHYRNPNFDINVKDNFTLNFVYTPALRQYDAGTLSLGVQNSITSLVLPPGNSAFSINSYCTTSCMNVIFLNFFNFKFLYLKILANDV